MKTTLLSRLAGLSSLLLVQQAAAFDAQPNRTAVPFLSDVNLDAVAASGPQYYIVWFLPPSGSQITNFVSTMTVPNLSAHTNIGVSILLVPGPLVLVTYVV